MLSRRELLIGAGAFATAALRQGTTTCLAAAAQPATAVNFDIPAGACDCHTHVFGDPRRFPFVPARTYTPEPASVALGGSRHATRRYMVAPRL